MPVLLVLLPRAKAPTAQALCGCAVGAFALGSGGGNRECTFNGGVAFVQLAHLLQNGGGFGITLSRQGCSGSKQQHGKAAEDRFSHFGLRI